MTNEQIIEAVTREVLAALAGDASDPCADCLGSCAAHCADDVRTMVANGASRVSYSGDGAHVPSDLAP